VAIAVIDGNTQAYIAKADEKLYPVKIKGDVVITALSRQEEKTVATSAHVDTLGLMVRSINGDGTLNVTRIGGPQIATLDGEYCKIQTRFGKTYTGTILCNSASSHVYEDSSKQRKEDNMIIRIDERVESRQDVSKLGIDNGDYVFIDPKFTITESGYIKSRFIDDKASVCVILTVLKYFKDNNIKPAYDTCIYFVNYEEVGHGAATIDSNISEFVTVDMGCVGKDLAGNEYAVSIAAKDSGGPYDYELTTRLIKLAKDNNVNYAVDIFPYYGSDVGAAYRAGVDVKGALIGQGVHASHGMERTHLSGIENTIKLLFLYLTNK
jgi:putative aminopeptidase FrvX